MVCLPFLNRLTYKLNSLCKWIVVKFSSKIISDTYRNFSSYGEKTVTRFRNRTLRIVKHAFDQLLLKKTLKRDDSVV